MRSECRPRGNLSTVDSPPRFDHLFRANSHSGQALTLQMATSSPDEFNYYHPDAQSTAVPVRHKPKSASCKLSTVIPCNLPTGVRPP